MTLNDLLTLVMSSAAILVTVVLAVSTRVYQRRAAEIVRRGQVVERVLQTMEHSVRAFGRPALLRVWGSPEGDALLLIPRFMQQLGPKYDGVRDWAWGEVLLQLREPNRRKVVEMQTEMALTLVAWQRGDLPKGWPSVQAPHAVGNGQAVIPARVHRARTARTSARLFVELIGFGTILAMLGRVWRLL